MVDKSFIDILLRNDLYMSAAYVLVISGIITTLLSGFGCFGAIKKVKCLLLTYFALVFCIFLILLVAGCLGYVFRKQVLAYFVFQSFPSFSVFLFQVKQNMKAEMLDSVRKYDPSKPTMQITESWDLTQSEVAHFLILNPIVWGADAPYSFGASQITY